MYYELFHFTTCLDNQHEQYLPFKQLSLGLNIKSNKEKFFLKAQRKPKVTCTGDLQIFKRCSRNSETLQKVEHLIQTVDVNGGQPGLLTLSRFCFAMYASCKSGFSSASFFSSDSVLPIWPDNKIIFEIGNYFLPSRQETRRS